MPTFEFDDGPSSVNLSGTFTTLPNMPSIAFTEDGVNFTLSTQDNLGFIGLTYAPTTGDGMLIMGDFDAPTPGIEPPITLDVAGDPSAHFAATTGGSIALRLGTTITGLWNITFVHASTSALNQVFSSVSVPSVSSTLSFATTEEYSQIRFTHITGDSRMI